MAKNCIWTGDSGTEYEYKIYTIDTNWYDVPGNYIFAKETEPTSWTALYIGETESFKDRLPNHEKLPCVKRYGGTHIHAHINEDNDARLKEEADLKANNTTPC